MNIYFSKDGRWESRISNGKKDGKRRFLYVFARTKEQCIEKVKTIYKQNRPQGYCNITLTDLFSEWHRSILHRVKESTAANYIMKASKHILPAFGDLPVGDITADCIYSFISEKQQAGFAPRYIADMVVLMKSVFRYAERTYQIANPLDGIILPKKKQPEIQLLDEVEQKTLQQYIGQHQNRSTLGVAIALTGGLRIGEICPCSGEMLISKNGYSPSQKPCNVSSARPKQVKQSSSLQIRKANLLAERFPFLTV